MRSRTTSAVGIEDLADEAAVGEEDDTVGVAGRHGVVGHHHDRLAELTHGHAHEREDLGAGPAVEVAGRFVGEDDLGPTGQGTGHGDPLLLPTGELARAMAEAALQADRLDHEAEPFLVRLPAGQRHRELDVLDGREGRDEVEGLEDEPDTVAAQRGERLVAQAGEVGGRR